MLSENCIFFCIFFYTDVNECNSGSAECHDNATCTNTDGSYECTCDTGFTGDGFNCTSELIATLSYIKSF